jgi:hypothetical protein
MTHTTASVHFPSYSLFPIELSDVTQTELLAASLSDTDTNINHSKETVIWSNPVRSSEWGQEPLNCSHLELCLVILYSSELSCRVWTPCEIHPCGLYLTTVPGSLSLSLSLSLSGFGGLVVSMLASGSQVRGFKPGRSRRIFSHGKILSMPSFGGEVK